MTSPSDALLEMLERTEDGKPIDRLWQKLSEEERQALRLEAIITEDEDTLWDD